MVDPQQVQQRGMEVVPGHRVLGGLPADVVGGPVGSAPSDTASGEPAGEPVAIVVTAGSHRVGTRLCKRRAAKLGGEQHQRVVEHSSLTKVPQ